MADGSNPATTPANSSGSSGSGRDGPPPPLPLDASSPARRPTYYHAGSSASPAPAAASAAPSQHPLASFPPGHHGLRRVATVAEPSPRRRAGTAPAFSPIDPHGGPGDPGSGTRRRDSTISSDCSFEVLSSPAPKPIDIIPQPERQNVPDWQSVPLVFALLPAVGGLMFKDGSAFVTDFLLLGLAAVFLHISITQPWKWYHSAQQIRVAEELVVGETVGEHGYDEHSDDDGMGDDDDDDDASSVDSRGKPLKRRASHSAEKHHGAHHAALRELYVHEIMALMSCFLSPLLGASILHGIRTQLSRPSEGLVSNYNLTVFLLAAEVRPVRHLIRLVEARTLHLQRIVLSYPFSGSGTATANGGSRNGGTIGGGGGESKASAAQMALLAARIEDLESRLASEAQAQAAQSGPASLEARSQRREAILREARAQMQPEVDALNRAVRRYEKKQTILAVQLDGRLQMLDGRLDDALALAAHAAKNSRPRRSLWASATDQAFAALVLPFRGVWLLACLPVRLLASAIGRDQRQPDKLSKGYRSGRSSRSSSTGADRFPTRVSRR